MANGSKTRTFVYAQGETLAWQVMVIQPGSNDLPQVWWEHRDAARMATWVRDHTGSWDSWRRGYAGVHMVRAEFDPKRGDVGWHQGVVLPPPSPPSTGNFGGGFGWPDPEEEPMFPDGRRITCIVDGHRAPCSNAWAILRGFGAGGVEVKGAGGTSFIPGLTPTYGWVENPPETGDACVNGVCPPVVTVHDTGGRFEIEGFEIIEAWLPQNTGFNLGNVPFTDDQRRILASSSNRINQGDCKKFINDTLEKNKVGKDFNSLEKLLNRAKLSYYDTSTFLGGPNYSPSQLGLDTHGTLVVRGLFLGGAAAVTAPDRTNVFLSDAVFARTDLYLYSNIADTPSFIVHELFHLAGVDKSIVDSQQFQDEIRKHCRLLGSDRILLKPH